MSLATDQTALLSLKQNIIFDPSHTLAANWTNSSSVCSWIGVSCSLRHHRVAALNLSYMNLSGSIPPQLGQLSFLASLDLTSNLFSGALPHELSFLHSFVGSIPKSLSNLTSLEFLNLNYNSLSGEIPKELGRLENLDSLYISWNHLFGAIPSAIFNLSKLVSIGFTGNELSGSLPTDMCTNLPFLVQIYFSKNQLSGAIPTNLSHCSELQLLSLSYNSFTGQIPAEIGYLTALHTLFLGGNYLNGTLPAEIGNLHNLVFFAVEKNQIGGSFPFSIFMNMSSLQELTLWRNKFTGNLSKEVGNLTMLIELSISENYMTGIIPTEIGQLYQMYKLSIDDNNLSGSIPNGLFNISTLQVLSLTENALSGVLPPNLCQHEALPIFEELYLGENSISGPIPNSISNCSQLRFLSLNENKFSGYIPTDLGNLRLLLRLDLFSNNLSSNLDFITSLSNCRSLNRLGLGDNPLYGAIPTSIGNLSSSLQQIYAAGCKLNGAIPAQIANLTSLAVLNFHDNELSGNVPLSIKHLCDLQGLYLGANMLKGPFPYAICDLYNLVHIDLSRNQFSGSIPNCLGNASSLRVVFLNANMFHSSIPSSLWGLEDLLNLDFSSNSFTGFLPQEISNLGATISIDLSMNQLSGSIPDTIGKLQNLANLSLANNRLEGSIPVSMGSMISLVALDLSHNNLSGSIPKSLEELQYLNYFNVSFNSLSGEIPSGGSFRNFTMDSFKGNEALCGIPRFHVPICLAVSNHVSKRKRVERALFVAFGVVAFVSIVSLAFILFRCKRKDKTTREVDELISIVPERISYYELMQATAHLSESNLLGIGSSCSVYKGILNNGNVVAVKVFNLQLQGILRRFDVECEILRSIRHRCLTSVLSCCSNEEFKALVLEYMPMGNLDIWLYSHNHCLNFMERLNIMIDVASALEYLHHGCSTPIVQSDLKPSNVLLDEDMVGHVSDFGIAKLLCDGDSMVLTNTLGTLGYIAPEYGSEGLVSTRCDVYSYGVMLMEVFTRKRPSDDMFVGDLSLKSWIERSVPEFTYQVIDANLVMNVEEENGDKIVKFTTSILELACKCSAHSPNKRINMKEAIAELQKIKHGFLG
ncbi:probable LRR receptor-like serine/threonine-protein kinase At3g47570 [Salvia hispanica]|uniref:probable LRR receptor-like serine/threonine-protein kinase At3g47570 n=1 Tax=Salvia hispanica TaxID=49212 RepID=UPI002009118A|nr:probable LRR receptor-like serine/threonine-protein kinase At3g47570 [Salvia hispanica]